MYKTVEEIEVLEERKELFSEMIEEGSFSIEDSRRCTKGNLRYSLQEILLVWLCGIICGFTTYADIEWYAESNIAFFRKFFPYKYGAPSRSTIARVIGSIDPKCMNDLLLATLSNMERKDEEQKLTTIALDGKALCGFQSTEENRTKVHIVSAFDTHNGITIAQESVPEKSNEIIAIKNILTTLALEGKVITIDALGTQKEIAHIIKSRKSDYILAVKENQKTLYYAVKEYFERGEFGEKTSYYQEYDKGYGRIEKRSCTVTMCPWLEGEDWAGLKSIAMVKSERTCKGKTTTSIRYFITSLKPEAEGISHAIRDHWKIESMHWTLDVTFNEDGRILWDKIIAQNEAIARRLALNMLKVFRETFRLRRRQEKVTYKLLQKILFYDSNVLETLLRKFFK